MWVVLLKFQSHSGMKELNFHWLSAKKKAEFKINYGELSSKRTNRA
jgi:hypothetical protein